MAQGGKSFKSNSKATPKLGKALQKKKFIAPKKQSLAQNSKLKKKLTSQVHRNIEETLAMKAGILGHSKIIKATTATNHKSSKDSS